MYKWFKLMVRWCIQITFHMEYKIVKILGDGNFAKVYQAININTNKTFAIKAFKKFEFKNLEVDKQSLIKEINILRSLNHPNVIKLKDVYEDENYIYVVVDLLEGDELMKRYHQKKSDFDEIYISQITNNIL